MTKYWQKNAARIMLPEPGEHNLSIQLCLSDIFSRGPYAPWTPVSSIRIKPVKTRGKVQVNWLVCLVRCATIRFFLSQANNKMNFFLIQIYLCVCVFAIRGILYTAWKSDMTWVCLRSLGPPARHWQSLGRYDDDHGMDSLTHTQLNCY